MALINPSCVGGGQRVGQGAVGAQGDRTVNLVEVDGIDPEALERGFRRPDERGGDGQFPRHRHEFGGDGHLGPHRRIEGQEATDDALALAASVDLGGVEQGDAGFDAGVPCLADRRFAVRAVVPAHAPGSLVPPGPRAHPERWHRDVGAGERDPVTGLRHGDVTHRRRGDVRGMRAAGISVRVSVRAACRDRRTPRSRSRRRRARRPGRPGRAAP